MIPQLINAREALNEMEGKMGKLKEESDRVLADEKQLMETNSKAHQSEIEAKQEVLIISLLWLLW